MQTQPLTEGTLATLAAEIVSAGMADAFHMLEWRSVSPTCQVLSVKPELSVKLEECLAGIASMPATSTYVGGSYENQA